MKDKIIEVMDKLSNITSLKDEYKFHWARAPFTLLMSASLVYVYPKSEAASYLDYMPSAFILIVTILGSMSLATKH